MIFWCKKKYIYIYYIKNKYNVIYENVLDLLVYVVFIYSKLGFVW